MTAMRTERLVVGYDSTPVAAVDDLTLSPDRLWIVHGPNGCGKTTLLKTLAGLLPAVGGSMLPAPQPGQGGAVYVHSIPVLWRGTIRSNLRLVAEDAAIGEVVHAFGLADWLDVPTGKLSHGIRQRASLARAAACAPRLLLVDEPEGGLDQAASERWTAYLESTLGKASTTLVIAAHRPSVSDLPASRIALRPAR